MHYFLKNRPTGSLFRHITIFIFYFQPFCHCICKRRVVKQLGCRHPPGGRSNILPHVFHQRQPILFIIGVVEFTEQIAKKVTGYRWTAPGAPLPIGSVPGLIATAIDILSTFIHNCKQILIGYRPFYHFHTHSGKSIILSIHFYPLFFLRRVNLFSLQLMPALKKQVVVYSNFYLRFLLKKSTPSFCTFFPTHA